MTFDSSMMVADVPINGAALSINPMSAFAGTVPVGMSGADDHIHDQEHG
jgi:hypothetical protein